MATTQTLYQVPAAKIAASMLSMTVPDGAKVTIVAKENEVDPKVVDYTCVVVSKTTKADFVQTDRQVQDFTAAQFRAWLLGKEGKVPDKFEVMIDQEGGMTLSKEGELVVNKGKSAAEAGGLEAKP